MIGSTNSFGKSKTAYIVVTAPESASISAQLTGYGPVYGEGACTLNVRSLGHYMVTCVYDGVTKTEEIEVTRFDETYEVAFVYNCTIVVNSIAGASIILSMDGQDPYTQAVTDTSVSFIVSKAGTWTVTASLAQGTLGASSKTTSVEANYGDSPDAGGMATCSVYPVYHIFRYGDGTRYIGDCGIATAGSDSVINTNAGYGGWRVLSFLNNNGGNSWIRTNSSINLTGYTTVGINYIIEDGAYCNLGVSNGSGFGNVSAWAHNSQIAGGSAVTNTSWHETKCSINQTSALFPIVRNNGIGSKIQIRSWWLE